MMKDESAGLGSSWMFDPIVVWPSAARIEVIDDNGKKWTLLPHDPFVIVGFDDARGKIKIFYRAITGWIEMKHLGACIRIV